MFELLLVYACVCYADRGNNKMGMRWSMWHGLLIIKPYHATIGCVRSTNYTKAKNVLVSINAMVHKFSIFLREWNNSAKKLYFLNKLINIIELS